jgi:hypothetical protein
MLACLAATTPARAQAPSPRPSAATEAADAAAAATPPTTAPSAAAPAGEDPAHDELRALRDGLLAAMNQGDVERELTYLHPNVVVTWHDATVSRGRDGVRDYLRRMLEGPDKKVANTAPTSTWTSSPSSTAATPASPSAAPSSTSR